MFIPLVLYEILDARKTLVTIIINTGHSLLNVTVEV